MRADRKIVYVSTHDFTGKGLTSGVVEAARSNIGAAGFAVGTWQRPMPASHDSFEASLNAFYDLKVRLEGTVSSSHFDAVRFVSEPQ